MPIQKGKLYDLDKVQFVIDGYRISGYAGDGQIEVENLGPMATIQEGADGLITRSRRLGYGLRVTVTWMETARSYAILGRLMQEMDKEEVPVDRSISLYDPLNGDEWSDSQFWFEDGPGQSKGAEAGAREFVLIVPNGRANAKYGANLLT